MINEHRLFDEIGTLAVVVENDDFLRRHEHLSAVYHGFSVGIHNNQQCFVIDHTHSVYAIHNDTAEFAAFIHFIAKAFDAYADFVHDNIAFFPNALCHGADTDTSA